MIPHLPNWIDTIFVFTALLSVGLFHLSNNKPKKLTAIIIIWSISQSLLAYFGFYIATTTTLPRFIFVLLPTTIFIIFGLFTNQRNWIIENRNVKISTFLHIVRIPVEIVLYYLFLHKMIPELMTFEGRNFDIIAGVTSPIIGFLYLKNKVGNPIMLIWNIICLCLILFILFNGILSAELPFQQFGFEQPNKAINYFPFILLPSVIVPLVIYTHLIDIIIFVMKEKPAGNNV